MKNWTMAEVDCDLIDKSEVNANYMTPQQLDRLKSNISTSGMSSAIACFRSDGRYRILSGNHRYGACVALGYAKVPVVYVDEDDLSNDEKIAIQLSHNSLHGQDDANILKELFDEISTAEFKQFSYIDSDDFTDLIDSSPAPRFLIDTFELSLVMFGDDRQAMADAFGIAVERVEQGGNVIMALSKESEQDVFDALADAKEKLDIRSTGVSLGELLKQAAKNIEDESND